MKVWYTTQMKLKNKLLILILTFFVNNAFANENFFNDAINLFEGKDYDKSKFLFQRNIVFNPKDSKSYLFLAKIYQIEEDEEKTEKNLNTALLLNPEDEEALYMVIDIELKRSNFSKVNDLRSDFEKICTTLCEKITLIQERLKNFDTPNES